jgi:hypothetical protein
MGTMRPLRLLILLALAGCINCSHATVNAFPASPNPNGCYVIVFDQPKFLGIQDVWNGPGRFSALAGLRRVRSDGWRDQIRSLRVGPGAMVTVFTDENFQGTSRQFAADADHPELDAAFSGKIESVQLACR